MTEEKTIEEIKADMLARGWTWCIIAVPGWKESWDCTIHDLTIETGENLYLEPMVTDWGTTENQALRAAYDKALECLPTLPARYDEHGIPYRIIGGAS